MLTTVPAILPTTLCLATAAVVVNIWLGIRISQARAKAKVWVGDGGDDGLIRRMRAQANFIEQTPLTLILFALVEAAARGTVVLPWLGAVFMLGRVAHTFGMDASPERGGFKAGRPIGMMTSLAVQIWLGVLAIGAATGRF